MMERLLVKDTETTVKLMDDKVGTRLSGMEKSLETKMHSKMEEIMRTS